MSQPEQPSCGKHRQATGRSPLANLPPEVPTEIEDAAQRCGMEVFVGTGNKLQDQRLFAEFPFAVE